MAALARVAAVYAARTARPVQGARVLAWWPTSMIALPALAGR
jgi:hypothetical protein